MTDKRVTLEEARHLIHNHESGRLLIPVAGTTRWVGVGDDGYGGMAIDAYRPADIQSSQALSVWGDQPLMCLWLRTNWSYGGETPHSSTREEWESVLHYLCHHLPVMTGQAKLAFYQSGRLDRCNQSSSCVDKLLSCLPPTLPHLMAEQGVREVTLYQGRVSGRTVLAFMAALHQEGLSVIKSGGRCKVRMLGGTVEMDVCLHETGVVGSRTTLEEARSLDPSPLFKPTWVEDGDHHYEETEFWQQKQNSGNRMGYEMRRRDKDYPRILTMTPTERATAFEEPQVFYEPVDSDDALSEDEGACSRIARLGAFPEITYHESLSQAVVVEIGGEVQLEAVIHGGPEIIMKWYHLDEEIQSNEDLTIISTEERTVLTITSCTEAHDGEYALKAHNSRGFFHSFFKISVFAVRPRNIHIKPPPPDIFGAKLSSDHSLTLKHPSSEITLTIPKGAVPEGVEYEVEGQILVDLNKYQHFFPDEEYLIAPIVDYNIKNKQFKEFNTPVEIRIPHHIIDANVRKNIKVYSIDGEQIPEPIGKDATAEVYYKILEKSIVISLKHFTQFPCTTHGQECEMEAILRLYMATSGKPGDHTAKLSPKLLLGCASSPEFKGNIYLDPGMVIKSQKQFELPNPHQCLSVCTQIKQSEPWKVLKDATYVETIEEQMTPVEEIFKNKKKIPKVISLSEYLLSESEGKKLSCTLYICFQYKDSNDHIETIQLEEDFSPLAVKVPAAQNFVLREQLLEDELDQVEPTILTRMDVNQRLISELKACCVLDKHKELELKMPKINTDKVATLMEHIRRDIRGKFLPLLWALQAAGQERVVQEFDTEEIRSCLNLRNREKSLLDNICQLKPRLVRQLHQSPLTETDGASLGPGWLSTKCLLF